MNLQQTTSSEFFENHLFEVPLVFSFQSIRWLMRFLEEHLHWVPTLNTAARVSRNKAPSRHWKSNSFLDIHTHTVVGIVYNIVQNLKSHYYRVKYDNIKWTIYHRRSSIWRPNVAKVKCTVPRLVGIIIIYG